MVRLLFSLSVDSNLVLETAHFFPFAFEDCAFDLGGRDYGALRLSFVIAAAFSVRQWLRSDFQVLMCKDRRCVGTLAVTYILGTSCLPCCKINIFFQSKYSCQPVLVKTGCNWLYTTWLTIKDWLAKVQLRF